MTTKRGKMAQNDYRQKAIKEKQNNLKKTQNNLEETI